MTTVLVLLVVGLSIVSVALLILYFDARGRVRESIDEYEEQLDFKVADLLNELDTKTHEILQHIDQRLEEGRALVCQTAQQVERATSPQPSTNSSFSLSKRYPEVFALARQGLSLREISEQTGFSVDRVRLILSFGEMQQ